VNIRHSSHELVQTGTEGDFEEAEQLEEGHVFPYTDQIKELVKRQDPGRNASTDDQNSTPLTPFATTLLVDYKHILQYHEDLADAILTEFSRFEPFLRKAIHQFAQDQCPDLYNDSDSTTKSVLYFLAMYNLPFVLPIRKLKTSRIGHLTSVSGTVTRTSEVRPELLEGIFRCNKCGLLSSPIIQQYYFTRPTLCRNPRCRNRSPAEFVLEITESQFSDWQKLRVQESSDEIPPGSMPRSIDVIVRNEMVERAKAGDACIFTGTLVVLPDGSALARAGEAPQRVSRLQQSNNSNNNNNGGGSGVQGLKALGVRELTYRTCFVASSVLRIDAVKTAKAASLLFGTAQQMQDHEPSPQEVAMEFSQQELHEIRDMKSASKLYEKVSHRRRALVFKAFNFLTPFPLDG
jgi:DNA replication licensing factor MCM6